MIDIERKEDCAIICFNRPDALNALNTGGLSSLEEALAEIADSNVRALVLTGAGDRAFCAGADIKELGSRHTDRVRAASQRGQSIANSIEGLPFPSIALLNGLALGGGLEIALACTFRLATVEARMGFPEIKLGVCTGWGGTQRLPRLVSLQNALDLLMSGRLIEADEAKEVGLVHSIVEGDPLKAAISFAERFTTNSLPAMAFVRKAIMHASEQTLEQGLRAETDLSVLSYKLDDAREGVAAFLEKREPNFTDQ
ncbi:MAG: enoyl-CoA hydratase/isomerase family protein [Pseudomonadota bacterium]|nr:enoyl-CoA hydratase/isomerase family protein [Pseudomonadota bacterium]